MSSGRPERASYVIVPAEPWLPDGVTSLAHHAEGEGIRIVSTVVRRWGDGTQRFREPGEAILAAVSDGEVIGIGARSQCPHVDGALRMRRFYVAPSWRRRGVAGRLASVLVAGGYEHAAVLTCNAGASAAAAPFWEHMGFVPVDAEGITHIRRRDPTPADQERR